MPVMTRGIAAVLFGILLPIAALGQGAACGAPETKDDGWQVAAPDTVGFNAPMLCGIGPRFTALTEANIHSVLVVRPGKLVYEHYFTGEDQQLGRSLGIVKFDAETKHDLRSITKSVTALVLGIEIGKGRIGGVDAPDIGGVQAGDDARLLKTLLQSVVQRSIGFVFPAGQRVLDCLRVTHVSAIFLLIQPALQGILILLGGVYFLLRPG